MALLECRPAPPASSIHAHGRILSFFLTAPRPPPAGGARAAAGPRRRVGRRRRGAGLPARRAAPAARLAGRGGRAVGALLPGRRRYAWAGSAHSSEAASRKRSSALLCAWRAWSSNTHTRHLLVAAAEQAHNCVPRLPPLPPSPRCQAASTPCWPPATGRAPTACCATAWRPAGCWRAPPTACPMCCSCSGSARRRSTRRAARAPGRREAPSTRPTST